MPVTQMEHATAYSEALHGLFPHLVSTVNSDLGYATDAMAVVHQYLLLGGEAFVRAYGGDVATVLASVRCVLGSGCVFGCGGDAVVTRPPGFRTWYSA